MRYFECSCSTSTTFSHGRQLKFPAPRVDQGASFSVELGSLPQPIPIRVAYSNSCTFSFEQALEMPAATLPPHHPDLSNRLEVYAAAPGAKNRLGLRLPPLEDRRPDCLLYDLFRLPATAVQSCNTTDMKVIAYSQRILVWIVTFGGFPPSLMSFHPAHLNSSKFTSRIGIEATV